MINVKFKKLSPNAIPFSYSREQDACMDMYALEGTTILAGTTKIISTGIAVEIPQGYEGLVRGRSGLASKGITAHLGTIDETYRGDIGIIITNNNALPFVVEVGMRLAQFTIKPVYRIQLEEVNELSNTIRGDNGYGSSGI
jgi:dUTP pyrophosphatase